MMILRALKGALLGGSLFLLTGAAAQAADITVTVILQAPKKPYPCVTRIFHSEEEIGQPFDRLCLISAREEVRTGVEDATRKTLATVKKAACTCGADAVVVTRESSKGDRSKTDEGRWWEEVEAIAIRLLPVPTVTQAVAVPAAPKRISPIKAGFRDLRWGDPLAAGMKALDGSGLFFREDDALRIGSVAVETIMYEYSEGKFVGVAITFENALAQEVLSFLTSTWGAPDKASAGTDRLWTPHRDLGESSVVWLSAVPTKPGLLVIEDAAYFARTTGRSDNGL